MALTKVGNDFYFTCLSTDIADSKVSGASIVGARVFVTDTETWYIINSDLTLGAYTNSAIAAGETHVGQVGTPADLIDYTLVLDTNQYASGDVMSISAVIPNVARVVDGKVYPYAIQIVDEDDQGQPFDLLFFRANVSIGTINQPFSIDDAGSRNFLGWVSVAAADFTDWGAFRTATIKSSDLGWHMGLWETVTGSKEVYVASISRGTGTYSGTGIKLKISVSQS